MWRSATRRDAGCRFDQRPPSVVNRACLPSLFSEFEDIDPNAEWRLDIHRLLILKKDPNEAGEETLHNAFEFAKEMANGTAAAALEAIRDGELPDDLEAAEEFLRDLADFLLETGPKGHGLAAQVCDDLKTASEVAEDEDMPKPLNFLALMALKEAKNKED